MPTMLKLFILAALMAQYADSHKINNKSTYVSEVLILNVRRATNLLIDNNNTLFFSYDSTTPGSIFHLAKYGLQNHNFMHVDNILNGRAITKNPRTDVKYFGAGQTIYRYNDETNEAENIMEVYNIQGLHMLGEISFTDIMGDVYEVNGDNIDAVDNFKAIRFLTVDSKGKVFYINDTGMYDFDSKTNETRQYFVTRVFFIKDVAVDKYDDVFYGGADGIFKLNQKNCTASKIASFTDVYGLAFDKYNNVVYSTFDKILRAYVKFEYR